MDRDGARRERDLFAAPRELVRGAPARFDGRKRWWELFLPRTLAIEGPREGGRVVPRPRLAPSDRAELGNERVWNGTRCHDFTFGVERRGRATQRDRGLVRLGLRRE